MKYIYILIVSLILCSCTQQKIEETTLSSTTSTPIQIEEPVNTTTITTTTTPKVTEKPITEIEQEITSFIDIPINRFRDNSYLETDLFKPFIIDGRFQSVGEDKTLYVWTSYCTEGYSYNLHFLPGGRVGCTLLNEKATDEMIDVTPFLNASEYGTYEYRYYYDPLEYSTIDESQFNKVINAFEGYIQFPDYFMYYNENDIFSINTFTIRIVNEENEYVSFIIDCVFENAFTVEVVSSNKKLGTISKLYVEKENARSFLESLANELK